MRTQVMVYCPFHRDTTWITQEIIEDYAGAVIAGPTAVAYCIQKWSQGDPIRQMLLPELLDTNPDFMSLQDELIEDFGIEKFIGKPRDKLYHVRQLEMAIERATDAKDIAALYKELRELRGWSTKPSEASNTFNGPVKAAFNFDKASPSEIERVVMSVFAASNVSSI